MRSGILSWCRVLQRFHALTPEPMTPTCSSLAIATNYHTLSKATERCGASRASVCQRSLPPMVSASRRNGCCRRCPWSFDYGESRGQATTFPTFHFDGGESRSAGLGGRFAETCGLSFISQRRHLTRALSSGWEERGERYHARRKTKKPNELNFAQPTCYQRKTEGQ